MTIGDHFVFIIRFSLHSHFFLLSVPSINEKIIFFDPRKKNSITNSIMIFPLPYRVNFLKYKKPERDLSNLNRSEVFKLIHDAESQPAFRISDRPPKVFSADDFKH